MVPTIRQAGSADIDALAALAERTFRVTFADDCTPDDMEVYVREAFSLTRTRAEVDDRANTFFLACGTDQEAPIGYAKLRDGEIDPSVEGPNPIELERIYVDQAAIGHGVGAALMRAAFDHARDAGFRTMWLGVSERNLRALAFYKQWGFRIVGDHVFQLGSDAQTDLIMERAIEP